MDSDALAEEAFRQEKLTSGMPPDTECDLQ
jgi:hypothetical protein